MVRVYSKSRDGETKLSEHFKVKEFACKDGSDTIMVDDELIEVLENVRMYLMKPVNVISGYRTESYNKRDGGANDSYHLKGKASDIRVNGISLVKLALICAMMGARGIGIYKDQNFIHIDTRDNRIVFREE